MRFVTSSFGMLFQSTLPQEERPASLCLMHVLQYFNPRSHKRSDIYFPSEYKSLIISIHAPTRGATMPDTIPTAIASNFNPRSHKRSDMEDITIVYHVLNFNPRSHKRSDQELAISVKNMVISIHAPTRGATKTSCHLL